MNFTDFGILVAAVARRTAGVIRRLRLRLGMNAEDVAVGIAKPQEINEAVRAFVERMPYRASAHATFVLACRLQGRFDCLSWAAARRRSGEP